MGIESFLQIATVVGLGQVLLFVIQKFFSRKQDSIDLLKDATGLSIELYEKQIEHLNDKVNKVQKELLDMQIQIKGLRDDMYKYKYGLYIYAKQLEENNIQPVFDYSDGSLDLMTLDKLSEIAQKYGIIRV